MAISPAAPPVETIDFPNGEHHEVLAADEHRLVIAFTVPPQDAPNTPHVHDSADEVFEVFSGALEFTLDGEQHLLTAGDSILIPRGAEHSWRVVGEAPLTAQVTFEPGCSFHAFLRDFAALHHSGRIAPGARPGLRDFALLQHRHRRDLRVTTVPKPVLRAIVAVGLAAAAVTGRRLP
jgi:mannose-6-phosphate isomerase-like protein (cupin superfamily)